MANHNQVCGDLVFAPAGRHEVRTLAHPSSTMVLARLSCTNERMLRAARPEEGWLTCVCVCVCVCACVCVCDLHITLVTIRMQFEPQARLNAPAQWSITMPDGNRVLMSAPVSDDLPVSSGRSSGSKETSEMPHVMQSRLTSSALAGRCRTTQTNRSFQKTKLKLCGLTVCRTLLANPSSSFGIEPCCRAD